MKIYYVTQKNNNAEELGAAFSKTIKLVKSDRNIKTITFLCEQKSNLNELAVLGFSEKAIARDTLVTEDGYHIQFRSVKTYKPNYLFAGDKPSEILIAVGVSVDILSRYEDYTELAYWVVIPQNIEAYNSFFSIWEAEDCTSSVVCSSPSELDNRIANAVDWLKATSFPNEGYNHPLDEDRLKNAAVTLKRMEINVVYDQVVYYCLHNGFRPSAARKTAEYFVRAQTHRMVLRDKDTSLKRRFNMPRE